MPTDKIKIKNLSTKKEKNNKTACIHQFEALENENEVVYSVFFAPEPLASAAMETVTTLLAANKIKSQQLNQLQYNFL